MVRGCFIGGESVDGGAQGAATPAVPAPLWDVMANWASKHQFLHNPALSSGQGETGVHVAAQADAVRTCTVSGLAACSNFPWQC